MIAIGCVSVRLSLTRHEQINPFLGDGIVHKM